MAKLSPDYIEWVLKLNTTEAQREYHKLEKENKELSKQNSATRKSMVELEKQGKKNSQEWKNLKNSLAQNNKVMRENSAKMGELTKRMKDSDLTLAQMEKRMKDLQREFKNTSKSADPKRYKELQKEIRELGGRLENARNEAKGFTGALSKAGKVAESVKGFFYQIGATIMMHVTGAIRDAFNIVVEFEKSNSKLASVLGTTRDGIKDLVAGARQLGAATAYSAAEVTGLQIELAKLGFAKQDILDMEGAVLKFAKAVDTDLARASAFTGAALRIFGKDASQAEEVLATFAVATTKTALDFSGLEASLSTVGPVAASFGLTIEDVTALLGQLSLAGFDASSAAAATRKILLNLSDANGKLAKALGQPEKSAEGLAQGLKKLQAEGVDLAKALELTDKKSVDAFSAFLKQADSIGPLKDSISGVTKEFNVMSDTMGDNVAGAMAELRSAAEELVLKISEGTEGPIKDMITALTSVVSGIGEVIEFFKRWGSVIKPVVAVLLTYKGTIYAVMALQKAYHAVIALGPAIIKAYNTAMTMVTTGFRRFKVAIEAATRSQHGLKVALAATPWGAVIAVLASVAAAFITLRGETDKLTAAQKALKAAEDQATESYGRQKASIESLVAAASNENLAMNQREAAVKRLNNLIPHYNAQIDATTGKYKASKTALDAYLKSLEKKIRYEANQKEYEKLMGEEEKLRREKDKADAAAAAEKAANAASQQFQPRPFTSGGTGGAGGYSVGFYQSKQMAQDYASDVNKRYEEAKKNRKELEGYIQRGVSSGEMSLDLGDGSDTAASIDKNVTKPIKSVGSAAKEAGKSASQTIDKIKELKARLKELREMDPQTDAEYEEIEDEKKKIQEQLSKLQGKGKNKNSKNGDKEKHEAGTYSADSLEEVTAPIADAHQKRSLDINKLKGEISETELAIKKNEELIRYCKELNAALETMRQGVKENHKQTLDKITKQQNKYNEQIQQAEQALAASRDKQEQEAHAKTLDNLRIAYENEKAVIEKGVQEQKNIRAQADLFLLAKQKEYHQRELEEIQDYQWKVILSDNLGAEEKRKRLEKTQEDIRKKESEILTDTGLWVEKIRELSKLPEEPMGKEFDLRRRETEAVYRAAIEIEKKLGHDTAQLEKAMEAALAVINKEESELLSQTRSQLGLTSWREQYQKEMEELAKLRKQGMVSEEDYEKKKFQLKMQYAQKYFDYYQQLTSSMFSALQEAEIATSDAKYDVLIQQAKNNGEETAQLEEEKENKKLAIQKKYADVNFAIKISQIIADTAVAIMKAFSELGPIGGAVATAMLTATGAAQVVTAKAERDKIKNMSPSSTASSSSSPAEAQRVLNGFSEGGYTGDGGRYEVAGVVHKGEYVIPKSIMGDRRVIDAVAMIEALRRNRLPAAAPQNSGRGFADGGFTSGSETLDFAEFREAVTEFREVSRNLRAYVVLRDIDRAREEENRARNPFRRKK